MSCGVGFGFSVVCVLWGVLGLSVLVVGCSIVTVLLLASASIWVAFRVLYFCVLMFVSFVFLCISFAVV